MIRSPPPPPRSALKSIRIGTAGYVYTHWRRGAFYPPGLALSRELSYYFDNFLTVEINTTWHAFPAPHTLRRWRSLAPKNARFALKVPRLITHQRRLHCVRHLVLSFCALAREHLQSNLGPFLFQCPPSLPFSMHLLRQFVADIQYVRAQCFPTPLQIALEFRDTHWFCTPVFHLLAEHDIALVDNILVHDHDFSLLNHTLFPNSRLLTNVPSASWRYLRFHGSKNPAVLTDFPPAVLSRFAKRVAAHPTVTEYAFFLNDWGAFAPKNAMQYARLVAAETNCSVTSLFGRFLPLWCRKPPSLQSFFTPKPPRKTHTSASEAHAPHHHASPTQPPHQITNHPQPSAPDCQPSPSSSKPFATVSDMQIPELPSDSDNSVLAIEPPRCSPPPANLAHIDETTPSSARKRPVNEGFNPSPKKRKPSLAEHGVKHSKSPTPKKKRKTRNTTTTSGVADIASFFAPDSEKG
ncbi:unnamed protein product [Agarophyton chilense]